MGHDCIHEVALGMLNVLWLVVGIPSRIIVAEFLS